MLQHQPGRKSVIEDQFDKVMATSAGVQRLTYSEALSQENASKNRDPNILPGEFLIQRLKNSSF